MCSGPKAPQTDTSKQQNKLRVLLSRDKYDKNSGSGGAGGSRGLGYYLGRAGAAGPDSSVGGGGGQAVPGLALA